MQYKPVIDYKAVREHYSQTLSGGIIHLSAHSHRAWGDFAEEAQLKAVHLAFNKLDRKWGEVFGEIIPRFCRLTAERAGTAKPELIAPGENTHELVTRVLSCFLWDSSTKIVSTNSEFHSLTRQLYRLKEEGVNVDFISTVEKSTLTERFINAIKPGTSLAVISTIFFNDGFVLQDIPSIIKHARENGTVLLFDAYHHFNVRRLNIDLLGIDIFMVAGGYKYAGGGEGAAWLKVPDNCTLRPRITGWFADFDSLEAEQYPYPVEYGTGAERFMGATRDISGILRQIASYEFMNEMNLTVDLLEEDNLNQTSYLIYLFDQLNLEEKGLRILSSRNTNERGPFLALDCGTKKKAHKIYGKLLESKIMTDTRGSILRIGPAPYTSPLELETVMEQINLHSSVLK